VERAVSGGVGDAGLLARAEMAKRTGDRRGALRDFEAMADRDARVVLELSKLYEHHVKDPARALDMARLGTGERPKDAERRIARLLRKIAKGECVSPLNLPLGVRGP